jgi:hypothetical protein
MDFDPGFSFQMCREFRERGVWLRSDLAAQQRQQLLVQRRRIAAAMRQRCETLACVVELQQPGYSATTDAKCLSHFIPSSIAALIGQDNLLAQVR